MVRMEVGERRESLGSGFEGDATLILGAFGASAPKYRQPAMMGKGTKGSLRASFRDWCRDGLKTGAAEEGFKRMHRKCNSFFGYKNMVFSFFECFVVFYSIT